MGMIGKGKGGLDLDICPGVPEFLVTPLVKLRRERFAVRHQRCRTPDSWRAPPRPRHSAPYRSPLARHTSAHPVQAVRTGLPVR